MDAILGIILLVVGTIVFVFVNKIFNVTYFGAKAIFGTWMTCVIATAIIGTIVGTLVVGFIVEYYKWIIGVVVVIALLAYLGREGKQADEPNNIENNEEKTGVFTAAPAPVVAAATVTAAADAAEEKNEFNVVLVSAGASKINVIKVVREVTGFGFIEAKALIDGAPAPVKEKVSKADANVLKAKLEEAGASVKIK